MQIPLIHEMLPFLDSTPALADGEERYRGWRSTEHQYYWQNLNLNVLDGKTAVAAKSY